MDTAGLKYKDKIKYYVSPSLEGCPPWRSPDAAPLMIEACQENSFCWLAPQMWAETKLTPPAYSNHQYELGEQGPPTELDGRIVHRNGSVLQTTLGRPSPSLAASSPRFRSQENLKPNVPLRSPSRISPATSSAGESYTNGGGRKRFGANNVDDGYFSGENRSVVSPEV